MSARRLLLALAAVVVAAGCDGPVMIVDDRGYDPRGLTPFIYHWTPGREIRIFVDPRGEPEGGFDLEAAVRRAITAWEAVASVGEVQLAVTGNLRDADVIVHHADAPSLITFDPEVCDPPVDLGGGRTYYCITPDTIPLVLPLNDGSGGRVKMDVRINVDAISDTDFFDAIVAHEIGHVLGIGAHSPTANDLMFGTPRVFDPTDADAATLRYVLNRRAAARF